MNYASYRLEPQHHQAFVNQNPGNRRVSQAEPFVSNFPESKLPTAETPFREVELKDIPVLRDDEILEINGKTQSAKKYPQGTREGYQELRNIGVPQRFSYVEDEVFVRENGLLRHPTYPTFKHEPWYPKDYEWQQTLDIFTGNNLKPMLDRPQKKENPPLYKPWKEPNLLDKNYIARNVIDQSYRFRDETSPNSRAFETPTETIRVPPGLNKGYTAEPDNRPFHPWFRAEPKTIDELRGYNRPSFGLERTTPGWKSGSMMRAETRRVDPKRKEAVYGLDERKILPQLGSFKKPSKFGDVYLYKPPKLDDKEIEYFGNKDAQNLYLVGGRGDETENFDNQVWDPTRLTSESLENLNEDRNMEFPTSLEKEPGAFEGSRRKMRSLSEAEMVEGRIDALHMRNNQSKRGDVKLVGRLPHKQEKMALMNKMSKYMRAQDDPANFNPNIIDSEGLARKGAKKIQYQGSVGMDNRTPGIIGKGEMKENLMLKAPKSYDLPLDFEEQFAQGIVEFDDYDQMPGKIIEKENLRRHQKPQKSWDYQTKIRTDGNREAPNEVKMAGYLHNKPKVSMNKKGMMISKSRFGGAGSNLKGVSTTREHLGVPVGLVPNRLIVDNETRPPNCCKPKKTVCDYDLYGRQTRLKSNRLANNPGPMPLNRDRNPYDYINNAPAQTVVKPKAELKGTLTLVDRTMYQPFKPPLKFEKGNFS